MPPPHLEEARREEGRPRWVEPTMEPTQGLAPSRPECQGLLTLAPDSDNFYDSLIIQCPDGRDGCYSLRSEEELTLKSTHFLFAFLFESAPPSYLVGSFLLKLRKQGLTGLLLTLALQRQYCLHLSPTQGLGLSLERISCISRYENRSCILSYRNVNRDASG